jgi:hypothetical protein
MQHYSGLSREETVRAWKRAIENAEDCTSVARLYKGGYWSTTRSIVQDFPGQFRGFVASAGVGLKEVRDQVPAYGATFNPGSKDSIPDAESEEGRRWWWEQLGGSEKLKNLAAQGGKLAVALPGHYLDVAIPDLLYVRDILGDNKVTVFTTDDDAIDQLGPSAVRLDARMSRVLGGPVGHVTVRALNHVLRNIETPGKITPDRAEALLKDVQRAAPKELFPKRKRQTETEVADWILRAMSAPYPPTSASAGLRRYRDDGFAVEQKRFGRLFRSLLGQEKS